MINKIKIDNFKCFKTIQLDKLARVNVIVGPNSAGKTALMEAIYLACGANPELALKVRLFRGFNVLSVTTDKAGNESVWKDIFNNFDLSKSINISLEGTTSFCRNLKIELKRDKTMMLDLSSEDFAKDNVSPMIPMIFEWRLKSGKVITGESIMRSNGISTTFTEQLDALPAAFYASSHSVSQEENANSFSALSVKNLEVVIVDALKKEFPHIRGLSVQIWSGVPCLFASMDNINEKIPLSLVSSGINKLIGILLGIATQKGGVILIDEIENGFYFDRLPPIWKLITEFAVLYNVQIFASTHSWECLQAAGNFAKNANKENNFTLIQSRNEAEEFRVHSGEAFISAINHQIDVR
jgi:AAA15 family ATPase/GTPase